MVLDLMLIGLGIALEPFPLTAFILLLSAEKGTRKGLAFVLGWLACLVVVIAAVILATGGNPPAPSTSPSTAVLAAKLALGVALVLYGARRWQRRGAQRSKPAWMARLDRVSLWAAAGLAAFLQPWALVAAGAATVAEAKLTGPASYLVLMLFILLATASFLYLELYAVLAPAAAEIRLNQLRTWLDTHRDQVIIVLCLLLGFWLAGKSIYLLVT
ncbi:MAG: GAP family protein [Streptosporangiaceae bacterium]